MEKKTANYSRREKHQNRKQCLVFKFKIDDINFTGEVVSQDDKVFECSFEALGTLFKMAETLIIERVLPSSSILWKFKDSNTKLEGVCPLPEGTYSIRLDFSSRSRSWTISMINTHKNGTFRSWK